jgi:ankyrin repeat protein
VWMVLDGVDHGGRTPLWWAATGGTGAAETIRLLAARGADVNCRDKSGETPLARALWENSPATADLLRSLGGKE